MAIVGPGAAQEQPTDTPPLLEGASEYEYVTLLNPLTDDFAVRVAQDVPVNMPAEIYAKTTMTQSSTDVTRNYGLDLKGKDFVSRKHIVNDTIIKAGQTKTFKGSDAQVAVRQLVSEVLQREGQSRLMADPNLRRTVEERIVIGRGSIQDIMDNNLRSATSQIDEAIDKSNDPQNERAFPGLQDETKKPEEPRRRGPGRPSRIAASQE